MDGIRLATDYEIAFGKELPFNQWINFDNPTYQKLIQKSLEEGREIPEAELEKLFDTDISEYDLID